MILDLERGDAREAPFFLRRVPSFLAVHLVRGIWGLKVSGLERLPKRGPLILAGNHVSLLDGPLLAMAADEVRFVHFMGKVSLFRIPLLGWYLKRVGAIPLDRKGDVAAMRAALDLLRGGGCLALFPEGTRSKTGLPGRPKAGIGFLAGLTGASVVPARLVNTDSFPARKALEVRFGPELRFSGDASNHQECLDFAQTVMSRIFAL